MEKLAQFVKWRPLAYNAPHPFNVLRKTIITRMKVVGLLSGGKDSCFNLCHCVLQKHDIVALATLIPPGGKGMHILLYSQQMNWIHTCIRRWGMMRCKLSQRR